ncbi:MAG: hypothetical protein HXS41_13440 [Theionarchaea archaeon]|nr:hypothetical protein [Theionarchaea archaeon]MBU7000254.1 hypothetical protein [Theionarchaea archaeon]MBU7022055.1 hypothetical protein [Theionarchaea archaeon]MBU7034737.1 hypothetical protein [Theionarchaea archaeon]MBU7040476.1 hypothetical protein [Theionarchaea archaeon]
MKRLVVAILMLLSVPSIQGGSNVTQRAVYLENGVVLVRFINMGVDAYWGDEVLANAIEALPILEDLIGVPLPPSIKTVEIYGRKTVAAQEWIVGYNDGNQVSLKTDHPDPTIIFHELVHFWTFHYHIPWPLAEGYCNLYADLCAWRMGYVEVPLQYIDWEAVYSGLKGFEGRAPLNSFNYLGDVSEEQVEYFYMASTAVMYRFYETVGEDSLKIINQRVAEPVLNPDSGRTPLNDSRGGTGILEYLKIDKEVTGVNHAEIFMPVVLAEWGDDQVRGFERGISRYIAVSEVLKGSEFSDQFNPAVNALLQGQFEVFQTTAIQLVEDYYKEELRKATETPAYTVIPAEKETGLLHNKLFWIGVITLVVGISLLAYVISGLVKEEEEFEWESPSRDERKSWMPPRHSIPEEPEEPDEERPETPDLRELTK